MEEKLLINSNNNKTAYQHDEISCFSIHISIFWFYSIYEWEVLIYGQICHLSCKLNHALKKFTTDKKFRLIEKGIFLFFVEYLY